jgi:hypothetical protein
MFGEEDEDLYIFDRSAVAPPLRQSFLLSKTPVGKRGKADDYFFSGWRERRRAASWRAKKSSKALAEEESFSENSGMGGADTAFSLGAGGETGRESS